MQEKFLAKKKELWMAFVNLEKTFDWVPREIVWWALQVVGVDEWIVKAIQAMYNYQVQQGQLDWETEKVKSSE